MNKSLIITNLAWVLFILIAGSVGISTQKPDQTKEWLCKSSSDFVDMCNLRYKPEITPETYKKRERTYNEPSAFEQNQ